MALLPKKNYISQEHGEVVLVWNYPPLLTKWTFLGSFIFSLIIATACLERLNLGDALLIGTLFEVSLITILGLLQILRQSDRSRSALVLDRKKLALNNWFESGYLFWHQISRIELITALSPSLPQSEFYMWIHTKNKTIPIIIAVPKLTPPERKNFVEVVKSFCRKNVVKFSIQD